MKNIYLIPTDKRTRLHYDHTGLFLSHHYQVSKEINSIVEGRYIYITSDEYIGLNWYIGLLERIIKKSL
jgi:transcription initiation factor IIF auxiliary subunit